MKEIHEEASAALSKACDDMTCYADQHRGSAPEYKVSDKVWLSTKDIKINHSSANLQNDNSDHLRSLRLYPQMWLN